jgi:transmembrane sensor
MTPEEIRQLAERIASGMATEEEIILYNRLCQSFGGAREEWNENVLGDRAELEAEMKKALFERVGIQKPVRRMWWRWSAAAAVLLMLAGGMYSLFSKLPNEVPVAKAPAVPAERFKNDVAPGQEGAILTLASGKTIVLDSAANGALAQEGAAEVIKQNGQIVYKGKGAADAVVYHTMTTPRGRQYHLLLADGTRVWLNAASSITYPTAFTGKERKVTITGEVYFEVAHRTDAPFEVQKDEVRVQVLGTHFNVNAYEEESSLDVTLLEGAVRVAKGSSRSDIRPGQQARVKGDAVRLVNNVDVDEVMAWKNGAFHFGGTSIETIMRQLERWYDVEVIYNKKVDDLFYAEIPRNTGLTDVLKALELTGEVRFAVEGKKVFVEGTRD